MTSQKLINSLSGNKAHVLSDNNLGISQENNIFKLDYKPASRPSELEPLKNHRYVIQHKKTKIPHLYEQETTNVGIDRSPNTTEVLAQLALECFENRNLDACTLLNKYAKKVTL